MRKTFDSKCFEKKLEKSLKFMNFQKQILLEVLFAQTTQLFNKQ